MKQKFGIYEFVHIRKDLPAFMSHFDSDFDAIVQGSYADLCSGNNIHEYAVYKIKDEKIIDVIAWYSENQLSSLDKQDIVKARMMIDEYHARN